MENDRYKILFERCADAILIIREDRFVDCNNATVKMLRYANKTQLLNTHPSQLSPKFQPDGRLSFEKANEMIETAFKYGSHRFEWDHKRADGEIFPVEVLLTAVEEEAGKTLHVVWRDITEHKQKQTDLLRLKSIIESTSDLIASATPDGRVFYTNDAAKKVLGGLKETHRVNIPDFHPAWAYDIIKNSGIPFAVANDLWEGETAAFTADGREIPVSQVIMAHKDSSGKLLYLSTIMRDMSEHYKNRAERLELQNRLHQAQKMEAIGTLAGGIAHDFNNILSGIFGYCQLAKNHLARPEKASGYIDEIISGSRKAAELIQQILTFSRKSGHQKKPLRLYLVIKEALKLLRASLPSTIEIKEAINTRDRVMADTTKIHQVVMNLCTNAYQAMRETGGVLKVSLDTVTVDETDAALPQGQFVRLVIQDTGPGIEPDIQDKIFEPYFTTKTAQKGTGLGLAVVHGIIEEHHAFIRVNSLPGKGTSFIIHFPVTHAADASTAPHSLNRPSIRPGKGHLLLVDDEVSVLNSTSHLLKYYGYTVSSHATGLKALEAFEKNPDLFDLVISDITMPGMTGNQLAKKILAIRPDIPVILCSGYNESVSQQDLAGLGIQCYLHKPLLIKDLLQQIQQLIKKEPHEGHHTD